jgi:hypothetical protein
MADFLKNIAITGGLLQIVAFEARKLQSPSIPLLAPVMTTTLSLMTRSSPFCLGARGVA